MNIQLTPHTDYKFTATVGGEERTFVLRKITLRIVSWQKQLVHMYLEKAGKQPTDEISYLEILEWLMEDPQLVNDTMREVYDGNHEGVDWFEVDADAIATMLGFFFIKWTMRVLRNNTASKPSSSGSATASSATPETAPGNATASSGASKPPPASPPAPPTTTTS